ncbi:MAG TPA: methyltransferase domain-containing protein [Blastocatellia bacterium]|nr:methyltransferase domain-containing protein [Blastocatellia bacterium]
MNPGSGETAWNGIHERVREQFGAAAKAYTTSPGHGDPALLRRVIEMAQPKAGQRALDIATGAGHTALALAPFVAEVVACDITPQMLEEIARNAAANGLASVITRQGAAERLPFADSSFDIVTVRQAPQRQARRVHVSGTTARPPILGRRAEIRDIHWLLATRWQ